MELIVLSIMCLAAACALGYVIHMIRKEEKLFNDIKPMLDMYREGSEDHYGI